MCPAEKCVPGGGARGPHPTRNDRETGRRGDVGIAPYEIAGGVPGGTANGGEKCLHLRR